MAEKPSSTIPSNEDVIDELTKDLESACLASEPKEYSATKDEWKSKNDDHSDDPWDNIGKEIDETPRTAPEEDVPLDFVDEESLKDREVTLSQDDKEKLRADAEALKVQGNDFFRAGEYNRAMITYTEGLHTCPLVYENDRAILYANRAAAKIKYMKDTDSCIADCSKAIELNPSYLKAYLRRAQLYEEAKKLDDALADFKKILELDPSHSEAHHAVRRLPPLIEEANEKLKTEMLGKLKELGNLVLKPFGLSTNNFELQQNEEGGGYSVKFNQNAS